MQFQNEILPGVSRTFALTIPRLPQGLRESVTNAYLLCRIADTIEDEVAFDQAAVSAYQAEFLDALAGRADAKAFAARVAAVLTDGTIEAERELMANADKVIEVFSQLPAGQRAAIQRCVERMCLQMPEFQHDGKLGLDTVRDLDRYCYVVAGVVGEMLTDLFCDHSTDVAANRDKMLALAASFGQGLQLTNILKDVWEDLDRETCWLPSDVFGRSGYDLQKIAPDFDRAHFADALQQLIAITHGHLRNALNYTLFIPKSEPGIRTFCIWCIELAVLTLQHIKRNPQYRCGEEVKVSKLELFATITGTRVTIRSNLASRILFESTAFRLPLAPVGNGYQSDYAQSALGT